MKKKIVIQNKKGEVLAELGYYFGYYPGLTEYLKKKGLPNVLATQASLYYSGILYWSDKVSHLGDDFFYKSWKEWEDELGICRKQQIKCHKALKKLGLIDTKLIRNQGHPVLAFKVTSEIAHILTTK